MKSKNFGKGACLIAAGLSAGSGHAVAALDPASILSYQVGALKLRPNVGVSAAYTDNVYYEEYDKTGDFISSISPGIQMILGHESFDYIALSYSYGHFWYLNEDEINAGSHNAVLIGHFEGSKLAYDGSFSYSQVTSPLSGALIRTTANRNRELKTYSSDHRLLYDIGNKTDVYGEAAYSNRDYEEGTSVLDVERTSGTIGFGYKYSPKTRFFGEVYYGQSETTQNVNIPKGPKRDFVGGFIGAEGDFTSKLTGIVKAGYENSEFSDNGASKGGPVFSISLKQNFTVKNALEFAYSRSTSTSDQQSNSFFTSDRVDLNFLQLLGNSGKLYASIGTGYEFRDYESYSGRTDNIVNAGFSLIYRINLWMNGSLSYSFQKIDSNFNGVIDYAVNRVTLNLSVGF